MGWTTYGANTGTSRGTLCESDSDGTKGDWETIAASSDAHDGFWVCITGDDTGGANTDSTHSVDIAFGGIGSEVIQVADINLGGANSNNIHLVKFHVPIEIPDNTRISARVGYSSAFTRGTYVTVMGYDQIGASHLDEPYGSVTTYGVQSNFYGTTLTANPVTTGLDGLWVQITAATTEDTYAFALGIVWNDNTPVRGAVDVATGLDISPTMLIEHVPASLNTEEVEGHANPISGPIHLETPIPAGTRIIARIQTIVSSSQASLIFYSFGPPPTPPPPSPAPDGLSGAWGGYPLGSSAWAADEYEDFSVPSDFDVFVANDPTLTERFVIIAYPYDPDAAEVVTLRWAQHGPLHKLTNHYPPKVHEAINYSLSIFSGEITSLTGGAPSFGAMRVDVSPNEGETEDHERYVWRDRIVEVYTGFDGLEESAWKKVVETRARGINIDETGFTIQLHDGSLRMQNPMQQAVYAGTGLIEGDERLTDRRRPRGFGPCSNVEALVIDRVNLVYQLHDQQIQSVQRVLDKGIILSSEGDVADVWAASPSPGAYVTDLSQGLIRLGSEPDGTVTVDFEGHVSPTLGYVANHALIAQAMILDYAGYVADDLNGGSFIALSANNSGLANYYSTGNESTQQALAEFLPDILGFVYFNALGKVSVGQVILGPVAFEVANHEIMAEPVSRESPFPRSAIALEYGRVYRVQTLEELAGGVTDDVRDLVTQEYRTVRDDTVADPESRGEESVRQTHFADVSGATIELGREAILFAQERRIWEFEVRGHFLQTNPGDVVRITYDRWRFPSSRAGIVLGITERSSTLTTRLTWWG